MKCAGHARHRRRSGRSGFTLIEMLMAMGVFLILGLILARLVDVAAKSWSRGQSHIQYRQGERTALEFMGQDLRQAILPIGSSAITSASNLQLVINPSGVTASFPDNFFWQAPVANDASMGDIAEVGYYIKWDGSRSNLYRFGVNPSDTAHYLIYSQPAWISDAILQSASASSSLIMENVFGMWVAAFQNDGTAYAGGTAYNTGDTRTQGKLPAYVQVSLVLLNSAIAARVPQGTINPYQSLYASGSGSSDTVQSAKTFVNALPASIRTGAEVATLQIKLDNYR